MLSIFINPGHDPLVEPGASRFGFRECDIALNVGQKLKVIMESIGYPCRLLQSHNLAGGYSARPNVTATANFNHYDIFISIHCNSFADERPRGTETLIYTAGGSSEILARCIQNQIVTSLHTVDRGIKERPDLAVLRETSMPAVLIELAFISNPDDLKILIEHQTDLARAIARGITDYERSIS